MNDNGRNACPTPYDSGNERITLAHGEGGRLFRRLLSERILPALNSPYLRLAEDAALLPELPGPPVISTDGFVVSPLFFPGGDIGKLAVCGTVNDLAVRGARPCWLTLSLVIEEGFTIATLDRILASVAEAAGQAQVTLVAGDTKVVPRGMADGIFLNTTGLGYLLAGAPSGARHLQVGDVLLVSGPIARHGVAVLCAREFLGFEPPPSSDCAPLIELVGSMRHMGIVPRAMRDATRGGVAAVLHEWSESSGLTLALDAATVPVTSEVRGVCELLGLDPLHVANEGTMVVAVAEADAELAISALRSAELGRHAAIVGRVRARGAVAVVVRREIGLEQPLDEPLGAPLPRIC